MKLYDRHLGLALGLTALLVIAGCSSHGVDLIDNPDTQTELDTGALPGSLVAPDSDAIGDMIVDMMNLLGTAPLTAGSRGLEPTSCPPSFQLINGLSGTCSVSNGVVAFTFGGTILIRGVSTSVDGTLVASPSASQPPSGSSFTIDFDATASNVLGTATWSSLGTVVLNAVGEVIDFTFNQTHTVTPFGGQTSTVTTVVTPSQIEIILTGPLGGTIRFVLDRESLAGAAFVNGTQVAAISFIDGCMSIDYVSSLLTDVIICPQASNS